MSNSKSREGKGVWGAFGGGRAADHAPLPPRARMWPSPLNSETTRLALEELDDGNRRSIEACINHWKVNLPQFNFVTSHAAHTRVSLSATAASLGTLVSSLLACRLCVECGARNERGLACSFSPARCQHLLVSLCTLADRVTRTLRMLPGQQPNPCLRLTLVYALAELEAVGRPLGALDAVVVRAELGPPTRVPQNAPQARRPGGGDIRPEPHTLTPHPSPLNPNPLTLQPETSTLNPKH